MQALMTKIDKSALGKAKGMLSERFVTQSHYKNLSPELREILEEIDASQKELSTNLLNDILEAASKSPAEQRQTILNLGHYFSQSLVPPVRPELLNALYNIKTKMQRIGDENIRAKPLEFDEINLQLTRLR